MSHRTVSLSLGAITTLAATLLSTSAFAEDASVTAAAAAPKMRAQIQVELMPLGSAEAGVEGGPSASQDTAVAYGISASFERAVHKYLSIGISPRLILNVTGEDADEGGDADKELDLRARITGHFPVAPNLEVYGSLTPGFTFVIPASDDLRSATGFALGAAAGATYDLSSTAFLNAELGYQRAFTSTDIMVFDERVDVDFDVSYLHVGLGAGTRF